MSGVPDWLAEVQEVRRGREVDLAFSGIAPVYEVWARLTESRARRRVLEAAEIRDGEAALEVATGTGRSSSISRGRIPRAAPWGSISLRSCSVGPNGASSAPASKRWSFFERTPSVSHFPTRASTSWSTATCWICSPRRNPPRGCRVRARAPAGGRLVLSNMTKGEQWSHRVWDALYARGLSLTANYRGVLPAPILGELEFAHIERQYVAQMLFTDRDRDGPHGAGPGRKGGLRVYAFWRTLASLGGVAGAQLRHRVLPPMCLLFTPRHVGAGWRLLAHPPGEEVDA